MSSALLLQEVQAGPLRLACNLDAGLHCVIDSDPLQAAQLVDLLNGTLRPRRGSILLGGRAVGSSVVSLPVRVTLPRVTVGQLLRCAIAARSLQCTAQQLLHDWERESWWQRQCLDLQASEQRALCLMLALGPAPAGHLPHLLALYEPFNVGLSNTAVEQAVLSAQRAGAIVLLVTPSLRRLDLPGLQFTSQLQLRNGQLLRWAPAASAVVDPLLGPARVVVRCKDARGLAAALSVNPAVTTLRFDESAGATLLELYGPDLHALAIAVNEAALRTHSEIAQLCHEPWVQEQTA